MKKKFRKSELVRTVRPEVDALVSFLPEGEAPSSQLQTQLDQRGFSRWYPVEGGDVVKMPFQGAEPPEGPFNIERNGWDHDHCDQCHATVHAGDVIWVTQEANFSEICSACYDKLSTRWWWPWSQRPEFD